MWFSCSSFPSSRLPSQASIATVARTSQRAARHHHISRPPSVHDLHLTAVIEREAFPAPHRRKVGRCCPPTWQWPSFSHSVTAPHHPILPHHRGHTGYTQEAWGVTGSHTHRVLWQDDSRPQSTKAGEWGSIWSQQEGQLCQRGAEGQTHSQDPTVCVC